MYILNSNIIFNKSYYLHELISNGLEDVHSFEGILDINIRMKKLKTSS